MLSQLLVLWQPTHPTTVMPNSRIKTVVIKIVTDNASGAEIIKILVRADVLPPTMQSIYVYGGVITPIS